MSTYMRVVGILTFTRAREAGGRREKGIKGGRGGLAAGAGAAIVAATRATGTLPGGLVVVSTGPEPSTTSLLRHGLEIDRVWVEH
jgi:hypothetical protein